MMHSPPLPGEILREDRLAVPNEGTVEAMQAARRRALVTVGGMDQLLEDLHAGG